MRAMTTNTPIRDLDATERRLVRSAVRLAVRYWPNSHLGAYSPREDIRSAFKRIRSHEPIIGLLPAVYDIEDDAYRHADM